MYKVNNICIYFDQLCNDVKCISMLYLIFASYICNIFVYEWKIWEWQRQHNLANDSSQRLIKRCDKTLKIHNRNSILKCFNRVNLAEYVINARYIGGFSINRAIRVLRFGSYPNINWVKYLRWWIAVISIHSRVINREN